MPLHPTWQDIALRLVLTLIAGAAIGFDRGVRGHAAGIRTTILVALAASVAMIQANILLPVDGKTPASFGVMDLMRLPLGILTGVGFIGGGAILRRGDLIIGVDDGGDALGDHGHRALPWRRSAWPRYCCDHSGRCDFIGAEMDR